MMPHGNAFRQIEHSVALILFKRLLITILITTIVIDEQIAPAAARVPKPPLKLKVWKWEAWPADATFRREDLYEDDGR